MQRPSPAIISFLPQLRKYPPHALNTPKIHHFYAYTKQLLYFYCLFPINLLPQTNPQIICSIYFPLFLISILSVMDFSDSNYSSSINPYKLLFKVATMIPKSHYLLGFIFVSIVYSYNLLDFHFLEDMFTGFRGSPVSLTYNSCSEIYKGVVSKCRILHGRYMPTPWLSSPHLQTVLLDIVGKPTVFRYRRQLFHASDGGTFALDWLLSSDVFGSSGDKDIVISKEDTTPIAVVIPGLTSDSASVYIKHLVFNTAKCGWNVVVCNHRGLGGVSITSDCFYNAGWTNDTRDVMNYLHQEYPKAPLFAIGTSIGANILVKYLREDGENVPVAGTAAVCCPWDLLFSAKFWSPSVATHSASSKYL